MTEWQGRNLLCFGDNLQFLTDMDMFPNECVDLIYLDPPFNSQQNYNVLFKEASGTPEAAQFKAFEDTWRWDTAANDALTRIHTDRVVPRPLVELMNTLMKFLKPSPMMAYLAQMAIRLVHMHRVLKRSGSLYLHCDPTASHYLKLLLDGIFGPTNFRNEIIWQRTSAHANVIQKYAAVHDVLLFYTASSQYSWNPALIAYEREYLDMFLDQVDEKGRRYFRRDLTASMSRASSGQLYEWKGIRPPPSRCWAMTKERMDELDAQGKIHWPKKVGGDAPAETLRGGTSGRSVQGSVDGHQDHAQPFRGKNGLPHPEAAEPSPANRLGFEQPGGCSVGPVLRLRHHHRRGRGP
jgi:hypothetical protein